MSEKSPDKYSWLKQVSAFTMIPIYLLVGPIIGYVIGNWLDKRFNTQPYLMVVGIILGFAASGQEIYRLIKKFSPKD